MISRAYMKRFSLTAREIEIVVHALRKFADLQYSAYMQFEALALLPTAEKHKLIGNESSDLCNKIGSRAGRSIGAALDDTMV